MIILESWLLTGSFNIFAAFQKITHMCCIQLQNRSHEFTYCCIIMLYFVTVCSTLQGRSEKQQIYWNFLPVIIILGWTLLSHTILKFKATILLLCALHFFYTFTSIIKLKGKKQVKEMLFPESWLLTRNSSKIVAFLKITQMCFTKLWNWAVMM